MEIRRREKRTEMECCSVRRSLRFTVWTKRMKMSMRLSRLPLPLTLMRIVIASIILRFFFLSQEFIVRSVLIVAVDASFRSYPIRSGIYYLGSLLLESHIVIKSLCVFACPLVWLRPVCPPFVLLSEGILRRRLLSLLLL